MWRSHQSCNLGCGHVYVSVCVTQVPGWWLAVDEPQGDAGVGGCWTDDPRIDTWLCVATEECFGHAMD